ncbi:hypothetical protein QJS66_11205 [Kocuria rhizophila]|nr:hypothetical protein QJS66_11205 [Kocuria rhizophila]
MPTATGSGPAEFPHGPVRAGHLPRVAHRLLGRGRVHHLPAAGGPAGLDQGRWRHDHRRRRLLRDADCARGRGALPAPDLARGVQDVAGSTTRPRGRLCTRRPRARSAT